MLFWGHHLWPKGFDYAFKESSGSLRIERQGRLAVAIHNLWVKDILHEGIADVLRGSTMLYFPSRMFGPTDPFIWGTEPEIGIVSIHLGNSYTQNTAWVHISSPQESQMIRWQDGTKWCNVYMHGCLLLKFWLCYLPAIHPRTVFLFFF